MSTSAIQLSHSAMHTMATAKNASNGKTIPGTSTNDDTENTVALSTSGKSLANLPPLLAPNTANVLTLSQILAEDLEHLFKQAGIDPNPSVQFNVDPYSGKVTVDDDREDKEDITKLLEANPKVAQQIHNVAAISSHTHALERIMNTNETQQGANSQEDKTTAAAQTAIAQYASADMGTGKTVAFSLTFASSALTIKADDQSWMWIQNQE